MIADWKLHEPWFLTGIETKIESETFEKYLTLSGCSKAITNCSQFSDCINILGGVSIITCRHDRTQIGSQNKDLRSANPSTRNSLKYDFLTFWYAYFRWENHNPGSTSKAELCTIRLLRIWHNSGFQISDNLSNYWNTIALRVTLPCRCNLVSCFP